MIDNHLVLAGGGHTHALTLCRWIKHPELRPKGLITLINRTSQTFYSGMIPGLVAGYYKPEDLLIDLRKLADQARISIVIAEIIGLDVKSNYVELRDRPPIYFDRLSLDVGSQTSCGKDVLKNKKLDLVVPIKPFEKSLAWISSEDRNGSLRDLGPLTVIGSGLGAIEIVLALRCRWPIRPLQLQVDLYKLRPQFKRLLLKADIKLFSRDESIAGSVILCTGIQVPAWLKAKGLEVDSVGRVLTSQSLQALNCPHVFAVGDCGVIKDHSRPASGVWAVRAANPLAKNLERCSKALKPIFWTPQRTALQLIGGGTSNSKKTVAWAMWCGILIGPNNLLWQLKQLIDIRFMANFGLVIKMSKFNTQNTKNMACRGCAAKFPAQPLKKALKRADLSSLADAPEDAAFISSVPTGGSLFQSIDGFPAIVSDPWLNARLTTLHACSDIWATGASVISAQSVVTLPDISESLQQELLAQSLLGIKSVLDAQGAKLLGGHTVESRSDSQDPYSLGIQIDLTINGHLVDASNPWLKDGLQLGDELLISRGIGSGVIFAAAMGGNVCPKDIDNAIGELNKSQHILVESILLMQGKKHSFPIVHACTDITGFGLLGHLEEMLVASNIRRRERGSPRIKIVLQIEKIPYLNGALELFRKGYASTLAPANRRALRLLESNQDSIAQVELSLGSISKSSKEYMAILELLVDPQTCGPLLISCSPKIASELVSKGPWKRIGNIERY